MSRGGSPTPGRLGAISSSSRSILRIRTDTGRPRDGVTSRGWLDRTEYPRILNPAGGRLWTANARVVGGEMLARLGDGGYEVGIRARQIRDRLAARDRFTTRDMLAIQMDASSTFLDRWRMLL